VNISLFPYVDSSIIRISVPLRFVVIVCVRL
jgi:hypothetical protein